MRTLSDFIRNATPEEKEKVYTKMMAIANKQQEKIMYDAHNPQMSDAEKVLTERVDYLQNEMFHCLIQIEFMKKQLDQILPDLSLGKYKKKTHSQIAKVIEELVLDPACTERRESYTYEQQKDFAARIAPEFVPRFPFKGLI